MSEPVCYCGHVRDEHHGRGTKEFPSSRACQVEGCECIHFEEDIDATASGET